MAAERTIVKMKTRYRLIGNEEQVRNFFAITQAFQNSTPMYDCIVSSSWPVAGNQKLGMCIQLSDKTRNAQESARAIAQGCGVELMPFTEYDEQLTGQMVNTQNRLDNCREFLGQLLVRYRLGEPLGHSSCNLQFTRVDKDWIERLLV